MSRIENETHGFTTIQPKSAGVTAARRWAVLALAAMAFCLLQATGLAQSLYWDKNGTNSASGETGGGGSWSALYWNAVSDGTGTPGAWTSGETAVFAAGVDAAGISYTISLDVSPTVGGLKFEDGLVTIGSGTLTLSGGGTFNVANTSARGTIDAEVTGTGGLVKSGPGELVLTAANSFSGSLTHQAGTLTLNNNRAAGTHNLNFAPSGGLTLTSTLPVLTLTNNMVFGAAGVTGYNPNVNAASGKTIVLNGALSGYNPWTLGGAGTVRLGGPVANTFAGTLTVTAGTLSIAFDQALGAFNQPVVVNTGAIIAFDPDPTTYPDMFEYKPAGAEGKTITLNGGTLASLSNTNVFDGKVTLTADSSLDAAAGTLMVINGPVTGSRNITKNGGGRVDLTGTGNNYVDTLVTAGFFGVWEPAIGGTGTITVNQGAKLVGNYIVPAVELYGKISAGFGVDQLDSLGQTWYPGSSCVWDIENATTVGGQDLLYIQGELNIQATSVNPVAVRIESVYPGSSEADVLYDFDNTAEYTWHIALATNGIANFARNKFTVDSTGLLNSTARGVFVVEQNGNYLDMLFLQPPVVTGPSPVTTTTCQPVTFSAVPTSARSMTYQWYFDGSPIPGATTTSYNIPDVSTNDVGIYSFVATDTTYGIWTSNSAALMVTDPKPIVSGCPTNINIDADVNQCSKTVTWIDPTATDNCPGLTCVSNHYSGETFPVGTTTVTYTWTDSSNQTSTCEFTVTVWDHTPPQLVLNPTNFTLNADGTYTLTPAEQEFLYHGSSDNCQGTAFTALVEPTNFTFCDVGAKSVKVTLTDSQGNSTNGTVTVTINAPATVPTILYVDAAYPTTCTNVTFPYVGGTGNYFIGYNAFKKIQDAINALPPGGTINVAAGEYIENVIADRSLSLIGPNAGVPGNGTRLAEAVIRPADSDPENKTVVSVTTNYISIVGFTIDGSNTNLDTSHVGYVLRYGVKTHAAAGVQNGDWTTGTMPDVNHIMVSDCVIRNISYGGVYLDRHSDMLTTSGFNYVYDNLFDNMWEGIVTYAAYAEIYSNVLTNVIQGIGVHGMVVAAPGGFNGSVRNNTMTIAEWFGTEASISGIEHVPGIWINYRRDTADALEVHDNVINTPSAAPGKMVIGLFVTTIDGINALVNFYDNVINGGGNCTYGAYVALCPLSDAITFTRGTFTGVESGIVVDTVGFSWGSSDSYATVDNASITASDAGVLAYQEASTPTLKAQVTVKGNSTITGAAAGVRVLGANAGAIIAGNHASIVGNAVGIEVNGGKALIEANDLTGNTTAGISVINGGLADAGTCPPANVTGLRVAACTGHNMLTGYGFDAATPFAISNGGGTVFAFNNMFGSVEGDDLATLFSGAVDYAEKALWITAPPAVTKDCVAQIPTGATTLAEFLAQGGMVSFSATNVTVSFSDTTHPTISGSFTRTYSVTNACGDGLNKDQVITVIDTPPSLVCPSDKIVTAAPGEITAVATYTATATDTCDGPVTPTFVPPSGSTFSAGSNLVTVTATDAQSQSTNCTFNVVVLVWPWIVSEPQSRTNDAGTTATFSVTINPTATQPVAYQWYKFGTNALANGGSVSGADGPTLSLANVQASDSGDYTVAISNIVGSVTSIVAQLKVNDPFITAQPQNTTNWLGSPASMSVTAAGTAPFHYLWLQDGAPLPLQTNSTLSIAATHMSDMGTYRVVVTNSIGAITSAPALMVILAPPSVVQQPADATVNLGASVCFEVSANGTWPFAYQWRFNGGVIPGATQKWYCIPSVAAINDGLYDVVITNIVSGVTSRQARLTVILPPIITSNPASLTNDAGTTAQFSVTNTGSASVYRWYFQGTNLLADGGKISGAGTADLMISNVLCADIGEYFVVVSNSAGVASSTAAYLAVNDPIITNQPTAVLGIQNKPATFSVGAYGTALTYQWRLNSTAIPGATGSSLTITNVQEADQGSYEVVVSSSCQSVTSAPAALSVILKPIVITVQPVSTNCPSGTLASFKVFYTGTSPIFRWFRNGVPLSNGGAISGADTDTITISPVLQANAGVYTVSLGNAAGTVVSKPARLLVTDPPVITLDLTNISVCANGTATFVVQSSGSAATYYWYKYGTNLLANGGNISGADTNRLAIANVLAADRGEYSVVLSNLAGTAASAISTLSITDPCITAQPQGVTNHTGATVSFTVVAVGTPTLTYQWFWEGQLLIGEIGTTLTLDNIADSDAGNYTVQVTGPGGSVTSDPAFLATFAPLILTQPANTAGLVGHGASFSVDVNGVGPFTYQWQKATVNIPGATNRVLNLSLTSTNDAGQFRVIVSNSYRSETSDSATLVVAEPVSILSYSGSGAIIEVPVFPGYTKAVLQSSGDMVNWSSIYSNNVPFQTTDPSAGSAAQKFYRAIYSQ